MTINISDFESVASRLELLGCSYPDGGIALLPSNLESASTLADLRQISESSTVKTLFKNAGLPYKDLFERSKRPPYIQNNSFEWVAPTIFVSAGLLSENPNAVSVALGVLANYATDFLKGFGKKAEVKLEVVVETTKTKSCKRITYSGSPEGLKEISDVVREIANG